MGCQQASYPSPCPQRSCLCPSIHPSNSDPSHNQLLYQMDPLTATLAVIALATAVKDITELGIKIRESFAKVPKNLLNAERVGRDISEMLEEIVEFSEQNRETLENAKEFRTDLQDLINALKGFESSTLSLLQDLKTCGRFVRMWTSWRKREEIEVTVQQLKDSVKNTSVNPSHPLLA
ncbi:hypothetical protein D9619_012915 [Psilocybe cf. subviscida]|uniref:Uncharacterized protein n=1 Tax=Psilocybe cf. subviscida TaxID=2480587 RepID=A0A8H5BI42_9AGAR|nr:hypothetical protein D9619_012915 [Psilocybe cf. subviscida]